MVRKSEGLLTLAVLVASGLSLWLWGELRAERALNAELRASVHAPKLVNVPEPASLPAPPTATPLPAAAPAVVEPTPASSPRHVQGRAEDWQAYQRKMMQQPKYREAWRAQQRVNYQPRRENVIRLLGLTPEQADAIIELDIDRQLLWYDRPQPDPMTEEYRQQMGALAEQDERDHQARLGELLGEEKRMRLQEYMDSRGTRMQVDRYRPQFTGADMIREDQVEPLIAAMHAEDRQMRELLGEYRETLDWNNAAVSTRKFGERQVEELKAAHQRMHSAAAPILSGSQLERLDELLKREYERRETEMRMQRLQTKSN